MIIRNNDALISSIVEGYTPEFVFFWNGIYSQWYPSTFVVDDVKYTSAEHYMMAEKARLFDDSIALQSILKIGTTPSQAKSIGRMVRNFDEGAWDNIKFNVVVTGNFAKFTQNSTLCMQLKDTVDKIIVEASAYDKIWGIGLSEDDCRVSDPMNWMGENLLGYALMETRQLINEHGDLL